MNRVEIKNKAKEMIRGNKWYIWKPLVMFSLVVFLLGFIFGFFGFLLSETAGNVITIVVSFCLGLIEVALTVAYAKYILAFIRGKRMDWKDVIKDAKEHFALYFLVSLVVEIIITLGSILFVVPGIIAAIGLMFYQEVCADNPDMKVMEVVKKSWEITKGHKMELFVMGLSFIGWGFLAGLTMGILYIWLMPYMVVSFTLAYEELKK